jgi:hypothetical protein
MLFSKIPNIEYDKKPLRFPFSETEYTLTKNFFRRYQIDKTNLESALYFNKYTMTDYDRPDLLSQQFYGTTDFDWLILITNNVINPLFDLPIKENDLYAFVEEKYEVPDGIHHYETLNVKNSLGEIILKEGLFVDSVFASTTHKFYDRSSKSYFTKNGSQISFPVSYYEYEKKLNDDRREIYILRSDFVTKFVSQFENALEYRESKGYIDRKNKKSGV